MLPLWVLLPGRSCAQPHLHSQLLSLSLSVLFSDLWNLLSAADSHQKVHCKFPLGARCSESVPLSWLRGDSTSASALRTQRPSTHPHPSPRPGPGTCQACCPKVEGLRGRRLPHPLSLSSGRRTFAPLSLISRFSPEWLWRLPFQNRIPVPLLCSRGPMDLSTATHVPGRAVLPCRGN